MLGRQGSSNSAFSMFGRRESDRDSRSSPRPLSATLGMALTPQRSRAVAPDEDPDNLMGQGWATSSVWSLWDTQHMEDWAASDARTAAALSEVVSREAIEEVFKPDGMTVRFKARPAVGGVRQPVLSAPRKADAQPAAPHFAQQRVLHKLSAKFSLLHIQAVFSVLQAATAAHKQARAGVAVHRQGPLQKGPQDFSAAQRQRPPAAWRNDGPHGPLRQRQDHPAG